MRQLESNRYSVKEGSQCNCITGSLKMRNDKARSIQCCASWRLRAFSLGAYGPLLRTRQRSIPSVFLWMASVVVTVAGGCTPCRVTVWTCCPGTPGGFLTNEWPSTPIVPQRALLTNLLSPRLTAHTHSLPLCCGHRGCPHRSSAVIMTAMIAVVVDATRALRPTSALVLIRAGPLSWAFALAWAFEPDGRPTPLALTCALGGDAPFLAPWRTQCRRCRPRPRLAFRLLLGKVRMRFRQCGVPHLGARFVKGEGGGTAWTVMYGFPVWQWLQREGSVSGTWSCAHSTAVCLGLCARGARSPVLHYHAVADHNCPAFVFPPVAGTG